MVANFAMLSTSGRTLYFANCTQCGAVIWIRSRLTSLDFVVFENYNRLSFLDIACYLLPLLNQASSSSLNFPFVIFGAIFF